MTIQCKPRDLPKPHNLQFRLPARPMVSLKDRLAALDTSKAVVNDGISWVFKSPRLTEIIARLLVRWQAVNNWDGVSVPDLQEEIIDQLRTKGITAFRGSTYQEINDHIRVLCDSKKGREPFLGLDGDILSPTPKLIDELKKLPA